MFIPPYGGCNFPYKSNLNWIVCQILELKDKTGSLEQAWEKFQKNFDAELDQTVKDQLTEWLNDGTLASLIFNLPNDLIGKRICIVGDSLSDENITWSTTINNVWVKSFRKILEPLGSTISNFSKSSMGFTVQTDNQNFAQVIDTLNLSNYDTMIIFGGVNDFLANIPFGYYYAAESFTGELWAVLNKISTTIFNGNNKLKVYVVTPLWTSNSNNASDNTCDMYRTAIANWAKNNGYGIINGTKMPLITKASSIYFPDGLHVANDYTYLITDYIISKILSGGEEFENYLEFSQRQVNVAGFNGTVNTYILNNLIHVILNGNMTDEFALPIEAPKNYFSQRGVCLAGNDIVKYVVDNKVWNGYVQGQLKTSLGTYLTEVSYYSNEITPTRFK